MASLSEVTTIRTLSGVRDVTSALNCTCIPREKDCQRMSSEQVFFRGTKYETRVDVGQCIGKCRSRGKLSFSHTVRLTMTYQISGFGILFVLGTTLNQSHDMN